MNTKTAALLAAIITACSPAWAINKCTGPDGKTIFQDAPCPGKGEQITVKPASGNAPPPAAITADAAASAPATPAKKKEGAFGESWQRRTYLENRGIADAEGTLIAHRRSCDQKQAELRDRQGLANNNLAGATYRQSIATEMQAAATLCDSRARELTANVDALKKELRELQAK